jgi:hypothetical protein
MKIKKNKKSSLSLFGDRKENPKHGLFFMMVV